MADREQPGQATLPMIPPPPVQVKEPAVSYEAMHMQGHVYPQGHLQRSTSKSSKSEANHAPAFRGPDAYDVTDEFDRPETIRGRTFEEIPSYASMRGHDMPPPPRPAQRSSFRNAGCLVDHHQYRHHQHEQQREKKHREAPKPIFADANAMKEKLRQNMAKPEYNVANYYHQTGCAQVIARHRIFERLTLCVILFNAVWIAIDTDNNPSDVLLNAAWPFQVAEHFFCSYFSFEWLVRFTAFKFKQNCMRDAWFIFDSIMITMMVVETWMMTLIFLAMGAKGGGLFNGELVKMVRLLRLSRMARMARLMRAMPELLILIKGMWAATRSVFFTLLLLFIILYIFGIFFTQMASGSSVRDPYFSKVLTSMHTLLIFGTLMDEIGYFVMLLGEASVILWATFYVFVLISALTVMNMLIGVLCEVVKAVAATEKESASVAYVKLRLRDIMKQGGLDTDGDGMISKKEFVAILDNCQAIKILADAGVDVFGLVDCADFIFQQDPRDDHEQHVVVEEKYLDFGDFMEVVLQLRGTNTATVKDIMDLRKFVSVTTKRLDEKLANLGEMNTMLGVSIDRGLSITMSQLNIHANSKDTSYEYANLKSEHAREYDSSYAKMEYSRSLKGHGSPMSSFESGPRKDENIGSKASSSCSSGVRPMPVKDMPAKDIPIPKEQKKRSTDPPPEPKDAIDESPLVASEAAADGAQLSGAHWDEVRATSGGLELRVLSDLALLRQRVDVELEMIMQRVRSRAEGNLGSLGKAACVSADAAANSALAKAASDAAEAAAKAATEAADAAAKAAAFEASVSNNGGPKMSVNFEACRYRAGGYALWEPVTWLSPIVNPGKGRSIADRAGMSPTKDHGPRLPPLRMEPEPFVSPGSMFQPLVMPPQHENGGPNMTRFQSPFTQFDQVNAGSRPYTQQENGSHQPRYPTSSFPQHDNAAVPPRTDCMIYGHRQHADDLTFPPGIGFTHQRL
eukprot:TRINITY_DN34068_c1_g1_i1.p1 TRINITY_DN34068_c1_g1~~TRINITY_DN34068_c1_g1_i1.p1  ORF type:complete len:998 (-),score=163.07 TRINITY_DN34068_c1_g1_i1:75-2975(-)